jgi:hypothetical protein
MLELTYRSRPPADRDILTLDRVRVIQAYIVPPES